MKVSFSKLFYEHLLKVPTNFYEGVFWESYN